VGRGIKEQKNIEIAKQLADALGRRDRRIAPHLRRGLAAHGPADRIVGPDGCAKALSGTRHQWSHPAHCRHEGRALDIAINKDSEAPIFEIADFGVVGNLFDIVPSSD